MTEIGLVGALLGGLLALVSPCSALLLPSFFAYAFGSTRSLVARTGLFYVGLAVVLVPLGTGIGAIGSLLTKHRETVTLVGGVVMVALGALIALGRGLSIPGVSGLLARVRIGGAASVVALGALYGLAGFCAGPLLGAVLTVAAAGGSAVYGGLLMGVYGIGMTVPLLLLALMWDRFRLSSRQWLRGREFRLGPLRFHTTSLISGLLFIGIGVLFVTTAGTANLGGFVGVDTAFDLQVWLRRATQGVTDLWLLFGIAVLALLVMIRRMVRASRRAAPPTGTGDGDRSAEVSAGGGGAAPEKLP